MKGKVIDLDDDWNSSEEATVSKKETIFHKVFIMIQFFKPSSFYSAGGKAFQHFMSNETVRNRKFNGRCRILLHSF